MSDINDGKANFIELLNSISPQELLRKQKAIEKLAPTLQYSVVRIFLVHRIAGLILLTINSCRSILKTWTIVISGILHLKMRLI